MDIKTLYSQNALALKTYLGITYFLEERRSEFTFIPPKRDLLFSFKSTEYLFQHRHDQDEPQLICHMDGISCCEAKNVVADITRAFLYDIWHEALILGLPEEEMESWFLDLEERKAELHLWKPIVLALLLHIQQKLLEQQQ